MGKQHYIERRYSVQAKRKGEKKWTAWTVVDDYDNAVKHYVKVISLGYLAKIIDQEANEIIQGGENDGYKMTNHENIKEMSVEELASFLCNLMCGDCCEERCPAKAFCRNGHTGMVDWLKSEVETE